MNGDGVLRVRVTAAARDNTIARVVRLVEEAQEAKAPTERFIDRFSRYYTPAVVAVAALVASVPPLLFGGAWHEWIYKGLAILLIGCPCALVISTPAAIAAGLSAGARRGLLIKGGAVLERLGAVTMVAFDKTGTLTQGRPGSPTSWRSAGRSARCSPWPPRWRPARQPSAGPRDPGKAAEADGAGAAGGGGEALAGKGVAGRSAGSTCSSARPRRRRAAPHPRGARAPVAAPDRRGQDRLGPRRAGGRGRAGRHARRAAARCQGRHRRARGGGHRGRSC